MTYTDAAKTNSNATDKVLFKNKKAILDGIKHKWIRDNDGKVGYIIGSRIDAILVAFPVKVLKNHVKVFVRVLEC